MGEKKLTTANLRKLLAKQAGITESKAALFLDFFFGTIVAGLKEDGQVKLNGLGTFKVQSVKPRKSVNIKTGESIIIEGYNKVVFTPEKTISEQANAPLAHLASVKLPGNTHSPIADEAVDPLKKLGEQAEEIKDILAEIGLATTPETEQTPETPDTPEITETTESTETPETTETTESTEPTEPDSVPVTSESTPEPRTPESEPKRKQNEFHPWKVAGITILLFCLLLVGAYFFLRHKLTTWADHLLDPKPEKIENVVSEPQPVDVIDDNTDVTPVNDINTIEQSQFSPADEQTTQEQTIPADPEQAWYGAERTYDTFIKVETLTEGSRLTHISRKYYGASYFWVYIYEANRDRIQDPNRIGIGTKLRIPQLPGFLIDTKNERSMKQAKELEKKILKKA